MIYEKKLQYPVRVDTTNPALAAMILRTIWRPDGECQAGVRYFVAKDGLLPTNQG